MADTGETTLFQQRLRERLDAAGLSMHALSRAIGANPGYVRDLLDTGKNTRPTADKLAAIARALETTTDYLLGDSPAAAQVRSEVGLSDKHLDWRPPEREDPGIPLVGTGDCAELTVSEAETGHRVEVERSSFDADYHVRMISRPASLRGARDLYAIYFHGSSMEPRFEPGDVGIVDPRRPVGPGDYVLVQLNTGDSDEVVSVLVKRLVRQTSKELVLEQFNPPLTFALPRTQVARVHRIMRQADYLF